MSVYKTPRSLIRSLSNILTPSNNNINIQNQNIQNHNIQNNKLNSLNKRNNNKNFSTNFTPSPIQTPKALIQKIIQAKAIKTSKHPLNPNFKQISNKKIEIKNENENENENENNLIQNVENIDFNLNTSDFSSDGEDNFNLESDSNDIQELEIINSPKKQYQLSFTNQESSNIQRFLDLHQLRIPFNFNPIQKNQFEKKENISKFINKMNFNKSQTLSFKNPLKKRFEKIQTKRKIEENLENNQNQNENQNQNQNENQNQNQNQNHKRQKIHSKPEFPRSLTRKIFSQFCKLRIEEDAMIQILKLTPLFFEQLSNDIHQLSNENDYISHLHFFSLMKNQRFISEEKEEEDLKDFIQKILPFELSEIIFPIARAGNKI